MGVFKFNVGDVLREKQYPSKKIRVVGLDFTELLYEFGNISKYRLSRGFVESNFELETLSIHFLPTKIIFDYDKKKTTLLFGDVPFESFNATASNGDDFNMGVGFLIAYYKYLNRNNHKHNVNDVIKYFYDFTNTYALFVGIVTNHLLNQGMSFKQVDKLFVAISEQKSVKFNIGGKDYHIEIEVRDVKEENRTVIFRRDSDGNPV